MNTPTPESPQKQPPRQSFLEQQRKHAAMPPKSSLRSYMAKIFQSGKQMIRIGALGGSLFLGHTAYENLTDQTPSAEAQEMDTLTDAQREEMRRLHESGSAAYDRGDFEAARTSFLRLEEIERSASIPDDIILSWNICLVEIRLAGFEFVNSRVRASLARPVNERNRLRLEEILGFTTIAQIQPVRDYLIDAQTRLIAIRTEYDHQLASGSTSVTQDLEDTRAALTFVETNLLRIEARYTELQGRPSAPIEPVVSTHETEPVVLTVPTPTLTEPEISEVIGETRPETHTERPWAWGLGIGGAGLALVGASAATYFAITPQSASEDQAVTTASNILFWTGIAATAGGIIIIVAGEHEVSNPPITTSVTAGPDGAMLRVRGAF